MLTKKKYVSIPEIRGDSFPKSVDCSPLTVDIYFRQKK